MAQVLRALHQCAGVAGDAHQRDRGVPVGGYLALCALFIGPSHAAHVALAARQNQRTGDHRAKARFA